MKYNKSFVLFNEMCFPRAGKRAEEVNWILRYGNPTREDLLLAASIISAYCALSYKTIKARNVIFKKLNEIEKQYEQKDK